MSKPCEMGFRCPYKGHSEDYETLCTYPYIERILDEDTTFGFPSEMDCPLIEYDSDIEKIIDADESTNYELSDLAKRICLKNEEDWKNSDEYRRLIEYIERKEEAKYDERKE